jgi:hypothetical protein
MKMNPKMKKTPRKTGKPRAKKAMKMKSKGY